MDCTKIEGALEENDIRVEVDARSEKLGYKIREARMDKVPYMIIIGEKEKNNMSVSIARRRQFEPCLRLVIFQFAASTSINVPPVRFIPFPCKLENHKRRTKQGSNWCRRAKTKRRRA